jgi:hypothetical protein
MRATSAIAFALALCSLTLGSLAVAETVHLMNAAAKVMERG